MTDKIDDITYSLSGFKFIYQTDAGRDACSLIDFFQDVRNLPLFQRNEDEKKIGTIEDKEHVNERYYSNKIVAENFLLVSPILLYRIIENALKNYLLSIYKSELSKEMNHPKKGKILFKEAIMTADIRDLRGLYKKSSSKIDIAADEFYKIIEEIRELNNSLKHNKDHVSKMLQKKNSYWVVDEKITVKKVQDRIPDFECGIMNFFCNLEKKLK